MESKNGSTARYLFPWFLILVAFVVAATSDGPIVELSVVIALGCGAIVAAIQSHGSGQTPPPDEARR